MVQFSLSQGERIVFNLSLSLASHRLIRFRTLGCQPKDTGSNPVGTIIGG